MRGALSPSRTFAVSVSTAAPERDEPQGPCHRVVLPSLVCGLRPAKATGICPPSAGLRSPGERGKETGLLASVLALGSVFQGLPVPLLALSPSGARGPCLSSLGRRTRTAPMSPESSRQGGPGAPSRTPLGCLTLPKEPRGHSASEVCDCRVRTSPVSVSRKQPQETARGESDKLGCWHLPPGCRGSPRL